MTDMTPYLQPDFFVDSDHPVVISYAQRHCRPGATKLSNAVELFGSIRDGFRYNPWGVKLRRETFKASVVAQRSKVRGGHCIDKAILLAACCRWLGIPSRLHFANVRNHIGTAELERTLGTDLLVFHGYAELLLEGAWVAATPAFNRELCEHLGVEPLAFDGRSDAILQQYDREGGEFMEYVHDYGHFPTIPWELMTGEWQKYYAGRLSADWTEAVAKRQS